MSSSEPKFAAIRWSALSNLENVGLQFLSLLRWRGDVRWWAGEWPFPVP
jgi:hypothetical protein